MCVSIERGVRSSKTAFEFDVVSRRCGSECLRPTECAWVWSESGNQGVAFWTEDKVKRLQIRIPNLKACIWAWAGFLEAANLMQF